MLFRISLTSCSSVATIASYIGSITTNNSIVSSIAIKNNISDWDLSCSVNVCDTDNLREERVY